MFKGSIYRGVMKIVRERIAEAQARHDAECKRLDEQYEVEVRDAEAARTMGRDASEQKAIASIISKIS